MGNKKRPFNELTPREVLALAIRIEQDNTGKFQSFAMAFDGYDDNVKQKFLELAEEEKNHEHLLKVEFEKLYGEIREADLDVSINGIIEDFDLSDSEHQVFDSLTPLQIMEESLESERSANAFYRNAAETASDENLIKLYKNLGEMETAHVCWLEGKIKELKDKNE